MKTQNHDTLAGKPRARHHANEPNEIRFTINDGCSLCKHQEERHIASHNASNLFNKYLYLCLIGIFFYRGCEAIKTNAGRHELRAHQIRVETDPVQCWYRVSD